MIQHFSKQTAEGTEFSTSSGFNAFGRPLKYRSASDAGVALRLTPAMPETGLILYAPLTDTNGFEVTGTPQFATIDNIPCMYFDGETSLETEVETLPQGASPRSFSFWFRDGGSSPDSGLIANGVGAPNKQFNFGLDARKRVVIWCYGNDVTYSFVPEADRFYHLVLTLDENGVEKLYIDGSLIETAEHYDMNTTGKTVTIGSEFGDFFYTGHMAAVRIYNRVLTAEEVVQLAGEFQRCVSVTCPDCGETYCATHDTHNCTSGGGGETPTDPDMPEPVFYVPLAERSDTAATGQPLTYQGSFSFEVSEEGIPYARVCAEGSNVCIYSLDAFKPSKTGAYTISGWVDSSKDGYAFGIGGGSADMRLYCAYLYTPAIITVVIGNTAFKSTVEKATGWHHVACVYDGKDTVKLYIDGTLILTGEATGTITHYDCYVFNNASKAYNNALELNSRVSSVRVFTSALSDSAIAQLAKEFQRCVSVICPDCGETYCATCDTHNCTSGGGGGNNDECPNLSNCKLVTCSVSGCGEEYCATHDTHNCEGNTEDTDDPDNSDTSEECSECGAAYSGQGKHEYGGTCCTNCTACAYEYCDSCGRHYCATHDSHPAEECCPNSPNCSTTTCYSSNCNNKICTTHFSGGGNCSDCGNWTCDTHLKKCSVCKHKYCETCLSEYHKHG